MPAVRKKSSAPQKSIPDEGEANTSVTHRRRNLRGRRGSLEDLPKMPLDILFEFFCYMQPMDLLNLARTNKEFRALLMNRSSATFWKGARQNVEGLPDCPLFLSEPAFANIAFSNHCHRCLKSGIQAVIWEFFVRYCPACKKLMIESYNDYRSPLPEPLDQYPMRILPYLPGTGRSAWRDDAYNVHVPDIEALIKAWANRGGVSLKEFLERHEKIVTERKAAAQKCIKWQQTRKVARSDELAAIRAARFRAVVDKLRALGWGEEIDKMGLVGREQRLIDHPLVKQSKPLTDRNWEKIRPDVVELMEKIKSERLKRIHAGVLRERFKIFESVAVDWRREERFDDPFPQIRDFLSFPEVRAIIDVPREVAITSESFQPLLPQLPAMFARWVSQCRTEVKERVKERCLRDDLIIPDDVDPLELAISSSIVCMMCKKEKHFPDIITHACGNSAPWLYRESPEAHDIAEVVYEKAASSVYGRKFEKGTLRIDIGSVKSVVEEFGHDPARVTAEEMDRSDIRIRCMLYCEQKGIRRVMNWRQAVEHYAHDHGRGLFYIRDDPTWEVASKEDTAAVVELEDIARVESLKPWDQDRAWSCQRCFKTPNVMLKENVVAHLKDTHKIDPPEETDLCYSPDRSLLYFKQAVFLVPDSLSDDDLPNNIREALKRGTAKRCELSPEPERRHPHEDMRGISPFWLPSDSEGWDIDI